MSNPIDPISNSLNIKTIQKIEQLNLSIIQKHHIRILVHCLCIFKAISNDDILFSAEENLLREWCNNQSGKFNDEKFNDLFYEQLLSASKKLKIFSQKVGKNMNDLDVDDLVLLVQEN